MKCQKMKNNYVKYRNIPIIDVGPFSLLFSASELVIFANPSIISQLTQKMTQKTATVTSTPEVHLPDAPSGGSSTTLGIYK